MPNWLDRPRGRFAAGAAVATLLLAAVLTPLALARSGPNHGNGATWNGNGPTGSISSTVYVAAINCKGVPRGAYRGQQSGIELFGHFRVAGRTVHPNDFAGVYSYCHGNTARYSSEFVVANTRTGELTFRRAGVQVAPGDPLELSIRTVDHHELLTITDMNSKRSAQVQGALLTREFGWSAGTTPIDANAYGAPEIHGSQRLGNLYALSLTPTPVKGPAPTAPVVFSGTKVDGLPISHRTKGSYASSWKGAGGKTLASVSQPTGGNFDAALRTVRKPRLGHTATLAKVGGQVTIKLPGSNRFITVGNVSDIPDGTVIDADHGSVQLTLALPDGKSQTGVFYSGEFRLSQRHNGQTTATLTGGSYKGCPPGSALQPPKVQPKASTASGKKAKGKIKDTKIRGLWSNAHGDFTTKGSYGAAAVLGTRWLTEDRCDGTYFYVARDKIEVTSDYPTRHRVLVTMGHSYLARAVFPTPTGSATDGRIGHVRLAERRSEALAGYPFGTSRGFTFKYYFKLADGGIRMGFASPQLLQTLPARVRRQVRGRVVWTSTWSSYYSIRGIHVHSTLATAQKTFPGGELIMVGSNDWYLARFGRNTAVFKIDNDAVSEVGIALASVTTSRAADRTLMSSFDS